MKKMTMRSAISFLQITSYFSKCGLPVTLEIKSALFVSGHQAQKEVKRQKGNRGEETEKRRGGEVEMVRSFWG